VESAPLHRNVDRVVAAAAERGVTIEPRPFPESTRTAAEAAAAIGVPVGAIVKTLVFVVDGEPVVALVSGDNQLDEKKLAVLAGGARCRRPDASVVREATGFPIGGVPPFGHARDLPVFVDEDLLAFEEVWAAAGTPHVNFAITPGELVRATGGTTASLAKR
jgi:Cys-tRNA(Pro) deacylase